MSCHDNADQRMRTNYRHVGKDDGTVRVATEPHARLMHPTKFNSVISWRMQTMEVQNVKYKSSNNLSFYPEYFFFLHWRDRSWAKNNTHVEANPQHPVKRCPNVRTPRSSIVQLFFLLEDFCTISSNEILFHSDIDTFCSLSHVFVDLCSSATFDVVMILQV
jgi:hypothetical protein